MNSRTIIYNNPELEEIKSIYKSIREQIEDRLSTFKNIWLNGTDKDIFIELVFCLLTPQSKARNCWKAVEILIKEDLVFRGCADDIKNVINIVRFRNKKSEYIIKARELLTSDREIIVKEKLNQVSSVHGKREWLVKNIKGIGYKEASHFLRNIGFGDEIAILDRHILKNLILLEVISSVPGNISGARYIDIENKMLKFADIIEIPVSHLDFVLWYRETGDIFK